MRLGGLCCGHGGGHGGAEAACWSCPAAAAAAAGDVYVFRPAVAAGDVADAASAAGRRRLASSFADSSGHVFRPAGPGRVVSRPAAGGGGVDVDAAGAAGRRRRLASSFEDPGPGPGDQTPLEDKEEEEEVEAGGGEFRHVDSLALSPQLPRKLKPEFRWVQRGAYSLQPAGLRSVGSQLFVCDSDDDEQLKRYGHCGLVGSRWQVNDMSFVKPKSQELVLPVRRWESKKKMWTAEDAPHAEFHLWQIPFENDMKVDMEGIPSMPQTMTRAAAGQLRDPVEAAVALPLALACPAAMPLRALPRPSPRPSSHPNLHLAGARASARASALATTTPTRAVAAGRSRGQNVQAGRARRAARCSDFLAASGPLRAAGPAPGP